MADLKTVQEKRKVRVRKRKRQFRLWKRTGKKGHLKAFRRHKKAAIKLRGIMEKLIRIQRPSQHFSYREFDCKDGTKVPEGAYPALDHLCQNYLEPLRAKFGAVYVTSGYRHRAYNARIGGATMSFHIYDYPGRGMKAVASDVVCATGTPQEWAAFLESRNPGGLCPYPAGRGNFVHVDNRQLAGYGQARGWL